MIFVIFPLDLKPSIKTLRTYVTCLINTGQHLIRTGLIQVRTSQICRLFDFKEWWTLTCFLPHWNIMFLYLFHRASWPFHTEFRCFHCWLWTSKCWLAKRIMTLSNPDPVMGFQHISLIGSKCTSTMVSLHKNLVRKFLGQIQAY